MTLLSLIFFFLCPVIPRDLHSFPTRRSSDLPSRSLPPPVSHVASHQRAPPSRWRTRSTSCAATKRSADRKSTRLNSSHANISYAVFCLKKKKDEAYRTGRRS